MAVREILRRRFLGFLRGLLGAILLSAGITHADEENGLEHRIEPGEEILYKQYGGETLDIEILIEGRVAVDGNGEVLLPNIGRIPVQGKTVREIKREYVEKFAPGGKVGVYYIAFVPEVESDAEIIEVSGGVPFPMKLNWFPGMMLADAIELCGGVTPLARQTRIQIFRNQVQFLANLRQADAEKHRLEANDKIYVPEILW